MANTTPSGEQMRLSIRIENINNCRAVVVDKYSKQERQCNHSAVASTGSQFCATHKSLSKRRHGILVDASGSSHREGVASSSGGGSLRQTLEQSGLLGDPTTSTMPTGPSAGQQSTIVEQHATYPPITENTRDTDAEMKDPTPTSARKFFGLMNPFGAGQSPVPENPQPRQRPRNDSQPTSTHSKTGQTSAHADQTAHLEQTEMNNSIVLSEVQRLGEIISENHLQSKHRLDRIEKRLAGEGDQEQSDAVDLAKGKAIEQAHVVSQILTQFRNNHTNGVGQLQELRSQLNSAKEELAQKQALVEELTKSEAACDSYVKCQGMVLERIDGLPKGLHEVAAILERMQI